VATLPTENVTTERLRASYRDRDFPGAIPRGAWHDTGSDCHLASFGVIGANMGCKLFVALQLKVVRYFIKRCAGGGSRRFEPPATFGAPKPPKTRLLNPYQPPAHGCLCRCASTSTRLLSRYQTCRFAISGSFRSGVLSDGSKRR